MSQVTFSAAALREAGIAVFVRAGVRRETAAIVAAHLLEAELCGVRSHGLIRLPQYLDCLARGEINTDAELTLLREDRGTALFDGQRGFGPVMARGAMAAAIERGEAHGVGVVTLVNCSHTGRLGSYTLQAAAAGLIGVLCVNAGGHGQWVAPFGGVAGRLSTNPLSVALPRGERDPLLLDIATSCVPEGKVRAMKAAGKQLPPGWICDHRGDPSTDPDALYGPPRGAILPLGGHKGFGLAVVVDLLAGALSGAGVCRDPDAPTGGDTDGAFFLALRVESFCSLETFARLADDLISHVKSSPRAPGVAEIFFPGEVEARCRRASLECGVTFEASTWATINKALEDHGVGID